MLEVAQLCAKNSASPLRCLQIPVAEKVIALAEAVAGRTGPDRSSPLDSEWRSLYRYLLRLSDGSLAELMALMWLGRQGEGDSVSSFSNLVEQAYGNLENGAEYLASKMPLADYLRRGLTYLRKVSAER